MDTKTETVYNLQPRDRLSSGISGLDAKLEGGFPTRGVLEICGESGSGKTQICLQLCITAQYPKQFGGLDGAVAYICTEDSFPSKRLQQLISFVKLPQGLSAEDLGRNIYIEHIPDFQALKECLIKRLLILIKNRNVKLLIIDSVAALFRGTYGKTEGLTRTQHLRTLGSILHELSSIHKVRVICVNQVTSDISRSESTVAALGLAWANLVTTRIQLSKRSGVERLMRVIFSPVIPQNIIVFKITEDGVNL